MSWLHGEVSKDILGNMWPGYFKNELHIGYVTNGVHFPTWIATSLRRLYAPLLRRRLRGPRLRHPGMAEGCTIFPTRSSGRSA